MVRHMPKGRVASATNRIMIAGPTETTSLSAAGPEFPERTSVTRPFVPLLPSSVVTITSSATVRISSS